MFRLIGNVSKKVYYEAENASDLNKWRLDNFTRGSQVEGHTVIKYDAPEAMVIVKVKTIKSKKEYLNDLLDEGKFEEYRKITMGNFSIVILKCMEVVKITKNLLIGVKRLRSYSDKELQIPLKLQVRCKLQEVR
jgi:hypothetical protein